jgi:hypothetical protein
VATGARRVSILAPIAEEEHAGDERRYAMELLLILIILFILFGGGLRLYRR